MCRISQRAARGKAGDDDDDALGRWGGMIWGVEKKGEMQQASSWSLFAFWWFERYDSSLQVYQFENSPPVAGFLIWFLH